jgi:hypothetical protein
VTTALSADSFLNGTPTLLFDFPIIAPGATVTEAFNAGTGTGLYQLTWNAGAPNGFVNSGLFILSAEWWDGDPLSGGSFIAGATDSSAPYAASVGASAVPEPRILLLLGFGAALVVWSAMRARATL